MQNKIVDDERKKQIVDACLRTFVEKGFYKTTSRDLSSAIKLQSGGIYYYFSSKDEIVVACAEEAIIRLENSLIHPAIKNITKPDKMIDDLYKHARKMAPTMKFFSQVCSVQSYREIIAPTLYRLSRRYKLYAEMFANTLCCSVEIVEPYVYIALTAVTNYMVFDEKSYIEPQLILVRGVLKNLLDRSESSNKIE